MNTYKKYPRTYHLPWSETISSDDKMLQDTSMFDGKMVVVTEKLDGENTTMYSDNIHARSIDSRHHSSRDWVKQYWASIKRDIPVGFSICGENVYAQHTVTYENLASYFYGFSIWEGDTCLSWTDTLEWFNLLSIVAVPAFYIGIHNDKLINLAWERYANGSLKEGYVIRLADSFQRDDFSKSVTKYVRKDHVATDAKHWMHKKVIANKLTK